MFTSNIFEGQGTFCGLKVHLKLNLLRLSLELPVSLVELYKPGSVDERSDAMFFIERENTSDQHQSLVMHKRHIRRREETYSVCCSVCALSTAVFQQS